MSTSFKSPRQRLAMSVFHEAAPLQKALQELRADGFEMDKVAVVAARSSLERLGWSLGRSGTEAEAVLANVCRGEAGGTLSAMHFVEVALVGDAEPLLASSGEWARLLGRWACAEKHDLVGLLVHRLDPSHARCIQRELETGALTLWVNVRDGEEEQRACRTLLRNSSDPVQIHDIGTEVR